jgi:raffinose/stachyose/melibiose transport system substrate-binding protein
MLKKPRLMIFFSVLLMLVSQSLVFAQDDVTLTWWVESTDQGELDHLQATLVEPFEEANPGINLEITGQENLQDVLRTTILGGEAPDILTTFGPSWG